MGVREILRAHQPDLILSGVNRGSNIADDVTYSGTIAAAIEGTSSAFPRSRYRRPIIPTITTRSTGIAPKFTRRGSSRRCWPRVSTATS